MRKLFRALFGLCFAAVAFTAAHAQSTINPSVPAQNSLLSSGPVRSNFTNAYNDINGLLGMHPVATLGACQSNVLVGTDCLVSTSATAVLWYKNMGNNGYGLVGTFDPAASPPTFTPAIEPGNVSATAPITASVADDVISLGLAYNSTLLVNSGDLGLNLATSNLWTATQSFDATTTPTTSTGNLYVGGNFGTTPTATAGSGLVYVNSTTGATLQGQGALFDTTILDNAGNIACGVSTGTTTWSCEGELFAGAGEHSYVELGGGATYGTIGTPSGSGLSIAPNGAQTLDYSVTNSDAWTTSAPLFFSTIWTGTSTQYTCFTSSGELIGSTSACLPTTNVVYLTSYGAKCNGVADDTIALQQWAAEWASGVTLVLPAGTCVFTSPLTFGPSGGATIIGAAVIGQGPNSVLQYKGGTTTATLLTFGDPGTSYEVDQSFLANFRVTSSTIMTSGAAIQLYKFGRGTVFNVIADGQDGSGNLWNGFYCDGCNAVGIIDGSAAAQNDDFQANAILKTGVPSGGCYCDPITIFGGKYSPSNSGPAATTPPVNGIHLTAGAAVFLDGGVQVEGNQTNVTIDTTGASGDCNCSSYPGNQSFTATADSNLDSGGAGIYVDDGGLSAGGGGKAITLNGQIASSSSTYGTGIGINIAAWNINESASNRATLVISGNVGSTSSDAIRISDGVPLVYIGPNTTIAGAGGYGVNCTISMGVGVQLLAQFANNTSGNYTGDCQSALNLAGNLYVNNTSPRVELYDPTQLSNAKSWWFYFNSGTLGLAACTDTGSACNSAWTETRSGDTPGLIAYQVELQAPSVALNGCSLSNVFCFNLGSDATGDIYYRNSSGNLARLGVGSTNAVLAVASGLPSWVSTGSGVLSAMQNTVNGSGGLLTYSILGTSGATVPLLDTANTWSAAQLFASTSSPTLGAGVSVFGEQSSLISSGFSTGYGAIYTTSVDGTVIQGEGSTYNFVILNSAGSIVCQQANGTSNFRCNGSITGNTLIPSSSSAPTNGLYLPTTNTPAVAANSTEAMSWSSTLTTALTAIQSVAAPTIASSASAVLDTLAMEPETTTISGSTTITTATGFNLATLYTPTYAASTSVIVENAATLAIAGAPIAGTDVTITNPYALWVQSGTAAFTGSSPSSGAYTPAQLASYNGCSNLSPGTPFQQIETIVGYCSAFNDTTTNPPNNLDVFTVWGENTATTGGLNGGGRGVVVAGFGIKADNTALVNEGVNIVPIATVNSSNATGLEVDLGPGTSGLTGVQGVGIGIDFVDAAPGSGSIYTALNFGSEISGGVYTQLIDIDGCWNYYGCTGSGTPIFPIASTGGILEVAYGAAAPTVAAPATIAYGFDLSKLDITGCVLNINISDAAVCSLSGAGVGTFSDINSSTNTLTVTGGSGSESALYLRSTSNASPSADTVITESTSFVVANTTGNTDYFDCNYTTTATCTVKQALTATGTVLAGSSSSDYVELEGSSSAGIVTSNGPLALWVVGTTYEMLSGAEASGNITLFNQATSGTITYAVCAASGANGTGGGKIILDTSSTVCGLSSMLYKQDIAAFDWRGQDRLAALDPIPDLSNMAQHPAKLNALDELMQLTPMQFKGNGKELIRSDLVLGITAQDACAVDDRICAKFPDGSPRVPVPSALTALAIAAIQDIVKSCVQINNEQTDPFCSELLHRMATR